LGAKQPEGESLGCLLRGRCQSQKSPFAKEKGSCEAERLPGLSNGKIWVMLLSILLMRSEEKSTKLRVILKVFFFLYFSMRHDPGGEAARSWWRSGKIYVSLLRRWRPYLSRPPYSWGADSKKGRSPKKASFPALLPLAV
jgi:hypothetical protein